MEPELQNGTGESQPSFVTCPRCSNLCNSQESFCTSCGNKLNVAEQQETAPQPTNNYNQPQNNTQFYGNSANQYSYLYSDVYLKDEDAYIQKNINYFKTKFDKMNQNNSKVSWNWCVFFFSAYWFIYRRMYALGFGWIIFGNIMTYVALYLSIQYLSPSYLIILLIILLSIRLTLCIMGNYIYKLRIDKLVNESKKLDEPYKTKHIEKNGGVSLTALIITIVVIIVSSNIVSFCMEVSGHLPY